MLIQTTVQPRPKIPEPLELFWGRTTTPELNVLTLKWYQDLLNEGHFAILSPHYQIFLPGPQWVGDSCLPAGQLAC